LTIDPKATPEPVSSQWNLKHLTILIVAIVVSFAVVGVAGTIVVIAFCSPAFFARCGQRLNVLYWIGTCYPLVALLSLYVTWFAAWFALGHPPRPYFDDPREIGPIAVPYLLTGFFLLKSPYALLISLGLMVARLVHRLWIERTEFARYLAPLVITPMTWAVAYELLIWDPLYVLYWYMD
jgi:hypothetical protein